MKLNQEIFLSEGMCHWLNKPKDNKILTPKMILKEKIDIFFDESREFYGSFRIQKMLEKEDLIYS